MNRLHGLVKVLGPVAACWSSAPSSSLILEQRAERVLEQLLRHRIPR